MPSRKSKSASAVSRSKNPQATLASTLESFYYRDAPPSNSLIEWDEKIATSKRKVHIEEDLKKLTNQISPSVGILATVEGDYGLEVVSFHDLEKH